MRLPIFPVWLTALLFACAPILDATACDAPATVCPDADHGSFALIEGNQPATVVLDADADPAVKRVAEGFASDLKRVSGQAPPLLSSLQGVDGPAVVIGVLGQSPIIDELVEAGRLDVSGLDGKWEAFRLAVVDNPWPNVPRANDFADRVESLYARDAELAAKYHSIENGKWEGMMSDVHMNYVIWQTPGEQTMPEVVRVDVDSLSSRSRLVGRGTPGAEKEVPHPDESGFGMTGVLTLEAAASTAPSTLRVSNGHPSPTSASRTAPSSHCRRGSRRQPWMTASAWSTTSPWIATGR